MNHLPCPADPALLPLKVQYLCADVGKYDGQGFEDFPSRMGWNSCSISQAEATNAARIQSWLYFGLLEEFFGQAFDRQMLIEDSTGGEVRITTCKLPAFLKLNVVSAPAYTYELHLLVSDVSYKGIVRGRPRVELN